MVQWNSSYVNPLFHCPSNPLHFELTPYTSTSVYFLRYHIKELFSNGQHLNISKQFLVHVVKEDETLTSLSKLYGVPIYEIVAANKEIIDVDLVFEGQHVNIPSYVTASAQTAAFGFILTNQREKIKLPKIDVSETNRRFKLCGKDNHKMLYVFSCRHLLYNVTDDREHLQSEELSRAYAKLDDDYQTFLLECGMSKWGYWRGGSAE